MNDSAKNSTSKQNNNPAEKRKTKTRNITECTGFRELITKKADTKSEILNVINKNVIFKNYFIREKWDLNPRLLT